MRKYSFVWMLAALSLPVLVWAQAKPTEDKKMADTKADADTSASAAPSFKSFKEAYAAGNKALAEHKLDEAAADYGAAENLGSSPKSKSQAANAQGWALLKSRKLEDAKKAFSRALEQNSDNKVALKNLGAVEYNLYEYGMGTVEDLKDAVKNLEASGENQEDLDRAKSALSQEDNAAKSTPVPETDLSGMNFKALLALSDKLQEQGQIDEALKVMKQAASIAASPGSKAAAANRQGKLLLDSHRPSESIAFFEEAVKYQPNEKTYLNNLGWGNWTVYASGKGAEPELKKSVDAFYKMNSLDPSYHGDSLKMALDELKEVDPDAAKAYMVKDDSAKDDSTSDSDKGGDDKGDKAKDEGADGGAAK
jgi:tetratricopeptide (TPR) repeat protein